MASGRQRYSIITDGLPNQLPDIDPDETREWLESFDNVVRTSGRTRARYVMLRLLERAREQQVGVPGLRSTDYINTIPPEREPWFPGDEYVERRIRAYIRWNAAVMVSRANRAGPWRRRAHRDLRVGGEPVRGRLQPLLPRQGPRRVGRPGVHPGPRRAGHLRAGVPRGTALRGSAERVPPGTVVTRRRPAFLSPPQADAGLLGVPDRLDGPRRRSTPSTRPGSTGTCSPGRSRTPAGREYGRSSATARPTSPRCSARSALAAREELDNLIFVINCNLQRLDGPVRGNGKIIQELESFFRGAGWNVIKVIWGRDWDPLLAQDVDGVLVNKMNTTPDGQFQTYAVESGAYTREHFFGGDPRLRAMVSHLSDDAGPQPVPRRSRLPQGLRRVQGGHRARRAADRDPGAHDQGLDARARLRGQERHPPDEEADGRRAQGVPGPALPGDPGLGAGGRAAAVLPPGRELRRDLLHEGAPPGARRLPAQAGRRSKPLALPADAQLRRAASAAPASSRSPPRWRSSGCSRT